MPLDELEIHTIKRDPKRPLRFTGVRIGYASSTADRGLDGCSGESAIGQVLQLNINKRGDYVASSARHAQCQGQCVRHDAIVTRSIDNVLEFFGSGRLAMELYASVELYNAEHLDEAV